MTILFVFLTLVALVFAYLLGKRNGVYECEEKMFLESEEIRSEYPEEAHRLIWNIAPIRLLEFQKKHETKN
jgi:hypothetical protein